jgi:hypothetical protein
MPDTEAKEAKIKNLYIEILSVILGQISIRNFSYQIRSEECGECTNNVFKAINSFIQRDKIKEGINYFELLEGILPTKNKIHMMPRFLRQYLNIFIKILEKQKNDYTGIPPPIITPICKKIDILIGLALKYFGDNEDNEDDDYLSFCRMVYPIREFWETFMKLVMEYNDPEVKKTSNKYEDIETSLIELGDRQTPRWINNHIPSDTNKNKRRRRIWSGGKCIIKTKREVGDPLKLKEIPIDKKVLIINFNKDYMTVCSKDEFREDDDFNCEIHFNSVDLPFEAKVIVKREIIEDNIKDIDYRNDLKTIKKNTKFDYFYILRFKKGYPKPKIYFLSLCGGLINQKKEWQPEIFLELFCISKYKKK